MSDSTPRLRPPFRAEHVGSLKRPDTLLQKRKDFSTGLCTAEELRCAEDEAIRKVIQMQRQRGMKTITDGEFRRLIFWEGLHEKLEGMSIIPNALHLAMDYVPSVAYFKQRNLPMTAYVCEGKLLRKTPFYVNDFTSLKALTLPEEHNRLKVTMCAPEWFHLRHGEYTYSKAVYQNDEEYFADIVKAYREEIRDLYAAGCRLHLCRGNVINGHPFSEGSFDPIAVKLFREIDADVYYLEYDSDRAGTLEPLRWLPRGKFVVLGLISSKTAELESKDALIERVLEAARIISDGVEKRPLVEALNQICISPQCGFASHSDGNSLTEDDVVRKLTLLVETSKALWSDA
ncbi:uncharacterized protein FIBRA_05372 [Fibroporia radiculosa]|uniref:Cobalamin-independent methionine synthase MetE C-terminal/archaeal domain-containing protein n=1 Tax=Fibroporia radiculosa TaxID=599839 RepID=J4IAP0_9APHY|nr:uncharacterized protein FIBRA_05372 [Fibroporia radiculosa]CCM03246.1 predicted protein [Fibroporia radiculosa]